MPIYEYRCDICGETRETLVRNGVEPSYCHNLCKDEEGNSRVYRVISKPADVKRPDRITQGIRDKDLEGTGLTKLVREEGGYRRVAGSGTPEWVPRPD